MQIPEHTWGLDVKTFLADYSNWSNKEFQQQLDVGAWSYRCFTVRTTSPSLLQYLILMGDLWVMWQQSSIPADLKPKACHSSEGHPLLNAHHQESFDLRVLRMATQELGLSALMACRRTLDAWDRQRGYNQWALEALGNSTEVSPADMQSMMTRMQMPPGHAKLVRAVCTGGFQQWQCSMGCQVCMQHAGMCIH